MKTGSPALFASSQGLNMHRWAFDLSSRDIYLWRYGSQLSPASIVILSLAVVPAIYGIGIGRPMTSSQMCN